MDRIAFRKLLLSVITGQEIWIDVVPEKKPIPAIAYSHIVSGGSRLLNGKKVNEWDTWRVTVIGKNRAECDATIALLKPLDNSRNTDFKRVFVMTVQGVPAEPDNDNVSSFIDFRTFDS